MKSLRDQTVLITGAARRIGAQTARTLHENGANLIIHYRNSAREADELVAALNADRPGSAQALQNPLDSVNNIETLAADAIKAFGGLKMLINNASAFFPTPLGQITEQAYDELFSSNFKLPLFLSQACHATLKTCGGQIINLVDIHAHTPLKDHPVYSCAKAANAMLVRSLAKEMAPEVRVNGIAPGAILWPENDAALEPEAQQAIVDRIPLGRSGSPQNIADTVLFLAGNDYVNGQIIAVDGGRFLFN